MSVLFEPLSEQIYPRFAPPNCLSCPRQGRVAVPFPTVPTVFLQMNPRKNPPPVWYSRPHRLLWMTGAALALSATSFAQSTDLPKPETDEKEQTVELSPFVIDASKDQGYRAT